MESLFDSIGDEEQETFFFLPCESCGSTPADVGPTPGCRDQFGCGAFYLSDETEEDLD